MDFKVGDVVRMKSGGPKMTVESVYAVNVGVAWFDPDDGRELHRALIALDTVAAAACVTAKVMG